MAKQFSPFSKEELLPKPEVLEIKKQKGVKSFIVLNH